MKNLRLITVLILSIIVTSCSSDNDDGQNSATPNPEAQDPGFQATINGGTFSDYSFSMGAYTITKGTFGNTLSIDIADLNSSNSINLFMNGTGGFGKDTNKQMGNIDSDNFTTNAVIRDQQSQVSYFSTSGNIYITNNREHPTEAGHRLISGEYNITATSIDGNNTTTMIGSFTELVYAN